MFNNILGTLKAVIFKILRQQKRFEILINKENVADCTLHSYQVSTAGSVILSNFTSDLPELTFSKSNKGCTYEVISLEYQPAGGVIKKNNYRYSYQGNVIFA